jgi:hypothetical protein
MGVGIDFNSFFHTLPPLHATASNRWPTGSADGLTFIMPEEIQKTNENIFPIFGPRFVIFTDYSANWLAPASY